MLVTELEVGHRVRFNFAGKVVLEGKVLHTGRWVDDFGNTHQGFVRVRFDEKHPNLGWEAPVKLEEVTHVLRWAEVR